MKALIEGKRWDMVFNIAEGLYGEGRESLVPALLDLYKIPYVFSGPVTLGISLNKAFAKQIIRDSGINTPAFSVVSKISDISKVNLQYPLFAKPISEGTGKGIDSKSIINSSKNLVKRLYPVTRYLSSACPCRGIFTGQGIYCRCSGNGRRCLCTRSDGNCLQDREQKIYSYDNKENYEDVVEYVAVTGELLEECKQIALDAWRALNCLDGGRVDVKIDRFGKVSFIEVNPLAGLNPVISDLPILCRLNDVSYQEIINEILKSAIKRNFPDKNLRTYKKIYPGILIYIPIIK